MLLKDKVAIITGGAQGIGRAIAFRFGEEGALLVLGDINEEALLQTKIDLGKLGIEVVCAKCDVTLQEDVQDLVSAASKNFGRIDILINNAGGRGNTPIRLEEIKESDWDYVMGVNLYSVFLSVQSTVPVMIRQGGGTILNMASVAARRAATLGGVAYAAAKGGVISLTRYLAMTLAPHHIRVNALAPGHIDSGSRIKRAWEILGEGKQKETLNKIILGRRGTPEEAANAALFLVSDESSYITGATIDVNGGSYMS